MIDAGFLDINDNGFDLADLAGLVGFVITVTVAGYGASRWANRSLASKVAAVIDQRTAPIQPGANGGSSLPDVARNVDTLVVNQQTISQELVSLKSFNEEAHAALGDKINRVANRLDDHAASPVHDRRTRQTDNQQRRRTDDKE